MDLTSQNKKVILSKRKLNADGSVTTIQKLKRNHYKKEIIASGVGTRSPTMGDVITSQLQPLRKIMTQQLNRRGFATQRMDFKEIIATYYNQFVANTNNPDSPYVAINAYEFRTHPVFRMRLKNEFNGDPEDLHQAGRFDNIGGVVDNIVSLFRLAKLKKRAAVLEGIPPREVMTDEELAQANAAIRIEAELEAKALNGKALRIGTFKNIVIIGLVIILLYQLLK